MISKSSFTFLSNLKKNNDREWFQKNKAKYENAQQEAKGLLEKVETELNKFDSIEKKKLFRIYRDVRFSKDKTPYNTVFRMSLGREGAFRRGGYYLQIGPGSTMIGGGFYKPEPKDLKLIRSHLSADPKALRKVIDSKKFKDTFGELRGEQVKTAPKGYAKDHPAIDLLKYKSFYVFREFSNKEATDNNFIKEITKTYKAIQPYFEYMSEILTHDLDGVPLYK